MDKQILEEKRLKFGEITIAELYQKYIPKEYWPDVKNGGAIHFKKESTLLFQHLLNKGFDFYLLYNELLPTMRTYLTNNGYMVPENEYEMFFALCIDLTKNNEPLKTSLLREDFATFHFLVEEKLRYQYNKDKYEKAFRIFQLIRKRTYTPKIETAIRFYIKSKLNGVKQNESIYEKLDELNNGEYVRSTTLGWFKEFEEVVSRL